MSTVRVVATTIGGSSFVLALDDAAHESAEAQLADLLELDSEGLCGGDEWLLAQPFTSDVDVHVRFSAIATLALVDAEVLSERFR